MTLDAAHKIDAGDEARVEVSAIKLYAAKVLDDVIDRGQCQVRCARGLTDEASARRDADTGRAGRIYDGPDEGGQVVAKRILKAFANGKKW